jgi:hypothetical protein
MSYSGENERVQGFLYGCCELGPRCSRVDAIGLGRRRSGAALYAESSGVVVAVGGETVWTGWPQVQIGCV